MPDSSKKGKTKDTDYDWRYRAVTTLAKDWKNPWTGTFWKEGDVVYALAEVSYRRGSVSFPVPDTTAMFLNLSFELCTNAYNFFHKIPIQKVKKKNQGVGEDVNIIHFYESLFGSIVFAYSALESFANHNIPDDYIYETVDREGNQKEIDKTEIERTISLAEKILNILPEIFGVKFTKQKPAWHDFRKLERIRHRIIHIKTRDTKSSLKDVDTIWNDLFKDQLIKPYTLAFTVIRQFVSRSNKVPTPRWYELYPSKMK